MLAPSHPENPAANPLVTMIVLCYNQARFVVETLESVKAQTYKHTELIIVDDCSTDDSVAVIDGWLRENRIECTFIRHQKNQGICKSLNEALRLTTGKYISMIAADDIWLPDKIERQVAIMESQSESVGVLYSDAFQIDENGNKLPKMFIAVHKNLSQMPQGQILDDLLDGNFIPGMTTLIRRTCYNTVGLYDEKLPWEDWDMWMRIARRYLFAYWPAPSSQYRIHPQSYTQANQPLLLAKDSFKICLKQFKLGDLTDNQKSKLTRILLLISEELYRRDDPDSCDTLFALWRTTGNQRARWMYRFSKLRFSFRSWERADSLRIKMRGIPGRFLSAS